ncbi:MAG: AI-2E family transporter [Acidimicrobiales bacterium]
MTELADHSLPPGWGERRPPRWVPRAVLYVLLGVAGFLIARYLFVQLGDLLKILLVALFLSFAIEPAVDSLADRGWRRGSATGLVFVVLLVLSSVLVWVMVDLVVQQVSALVDDAPKLIRNATNWVNERFDANITTDSIIRQVRKYQGDLASTAGDVGGRVVSITGSVIAVVFNVFTIGLFSFYLVADGPRFRRSLCSVLPPERQRQVLELWELAIHKTGAYLYSRLVLALASAVCSWIAFAIIGVPSPLALAVWLGIVSQFVPVIGTYIGGALPVVIALLNRPAHAIGVLIFLVVYQQIENYLLAPRISAATMAIHPAVAFGSAIAGASIIGPIGALLALPAAAIIQAFVSAYIERHDIVENELTEALLDTVVESPRGRRLHPSGRRGGGCDRSPGGAAGSGRRGRRLRCRAGQRGRRPAAHVGAIRRRPRRALLGPIGAHGTDQGSAGGHREMERRAHAEVGDAGGAPGLERERAGVADEHVLLGPDVAERPREPPERQCGGEVAGTGPERSRSVTESDPTTVEARHATVHRGEHVDPLRAEARADARGHLVAPAWSDRCVRDEVANRTVSRRIRCHRVVLECGPEVRP